MNRSSIFHFVLATSLLGSACDRPELQWELVDTPTPTPREVENPETSAEDASDPNASTASGECTRGTGKDARGICIPLRTRMAAHVQQVQLPRGRFVMGDPPVAYDAAPARGEPQLLWDGQPPRHVDVDAFWIDLHEVTRKAYDECVAEGKCTPARCPEGDDPTADMTIDAAAIVPQTCVTHEQAEAFCAARGGRLPTEVEWEYAARGVDARIYPWGNDFKDEIPGGLLPVTAGVTDLSYFGLRGMASSGEEWVADRWTPDVPLEPFVRKPFRSPGGPLLRALGRETRHVTKAGRVGRRNARVGPDPLRGFRCAADLEPADEPFTVPAEAPPVPLIRDTGRGLSIFGGVAEAVSFEEAERFCQVLAVPHDGETVADWRLPTLDEVRTIADAFRGPGPFWTKDGAVVQRGEGTRPLPDDPWQPEDATSNEALAARCVRGE